METISRLPVKAGRPRRHPAAAIACMALGMFWTLATALAAESLEQAVKAAYLYKFGLFVEWPSAAFTSSSSALNVCVVGDDPFGTALDSAANGQRIGGREVMVRRMKTVGRESGCHILYAAGSETQAPGQIIAAVRGSGVLTVTDARGPGATEGIINFVIKDNRVRFDIDEAAATQNGLAISSKLLSLALEVKRKGPSAQGGGR